MTTWHNKIIGHADVDPEQLLAHPLNFRVHPKAQQDALAGVISDIGYIRSVTVNQQTGHVVDGHLRVALALRQGQKSIPVEYVDLSPEEEAEALATIDPIAAMAAVDAAKLEELLHEVLTDDPALQAMLDELAQDAGIVPGLAGSELDIPEPQIDKAAELQQKWETEVGQIWQLGNHRLAVGDCRDSELVDRLMQGEKLRMVWTDPPYGVSYADKNRFLNAVTSGQRIQEPIQNDHMTEGETESLTRSSLTLAAQYGLEGAGCYLAVPPGPLHRRFIDAFNDAGFTYKHQLIWVKNQFVLGRSDYHYRHEPILYGWIESGAHYFIDDHSQDTVFEIDKPRSSALHPTMKPVELIEQMVKNSSKQSEIVYDPFSGSGSTLLACERLGRRCRAIEIDPGYAAVTLQRWSDMTGEQPELEEVG